MTPRDMRQLRVLSLFHYLVAFLEALSVMILIVSFSRGVGIATGRSSEMAELSASYGWALLGFSALGIVVGVGIAALTYAAGRRIAERRAYSFCVVVAAINCIYFPFGTILGTLTIIVLKRPQVQEAFTPKPPHHPNVAAWEGTKLP